MDSKFIVNYLKENDLTAYLVNKETGVSINTINDLIDGKRIPRKATIEKLLLFIETHHKNMLGLDEMKKTLVSEPTSEYNEVTNRELLNALQHLTDMIGQNGILMTDLLGKTYRNTKAILKEVNTINDKSLKDLRDDLTKLYHE